MKMTNPFSKSSVDWDVPSVAFGAWAECDVRTVNAVGDTVTIDIYDIIGEDFWDGSGFTEKKLAGILRDAGGRDLTVNINSPGGDMFAGLAMHNRLKQYAGNVTVNVIGIAASAASIIAVAGNEVVMHTGAVMMIHNAWSVVIGNRHEFASAASDFEVFDRSLADIYSKVSGVSVDEVMTMMDGESDGTYMTSENAVELGFAHSVSSDALPVSQLPENVVAKRRIEASLAKDGMPRKMRAKYMKQVSGVSESAENVERDADKSEVSDALSGLLNAMKG